MAVPDAYRERRQNDELVDWRLARIEKQVDANGASLAALERRINYLFGGLALLVGAVNLVGPMIIHYITKGTP
jgi:hypothetical protein